MSDTNSYLEVGKIGKAHGLKGDIKVSFEAFFFPYLDDIKMLFVELQGTMVPFFTERLEHSNPLHVLLKFEGINNREAAIDLHQKILYADPSHYKGLEDELAAEQIFNAIVGYEALLENGQSIGAIKEIFYLPHQALAQCIYQEQEILLPMHADLLGEIDHEKAVVHLNINEDYLEVYLNDEAKDDD